MIMKHILNILFSRFGNINIKFCGLAHFVSEHFILILILFSYYCYYIAIDSL